MTKRSTKKKLHLTQLTISIIFLITITPSPTYSKPCIVDKCQTCPNNSTVDCTMCETGWYLRNFTGGDKPYNECWSLAKLWLSIFGFAILGLLLCGLCYYCYMLGKKWRVNKTAKNQNYRFEGPPQTLMTEASVPVQQPLNSSPQPVLRQMPPSPPPEGTVPIYQQQQQPVYIQGGSPRVIQSPTRPIMRPSNIPQGARIVRPSGGVIRDGGIPRESYVSPQRNPVIRRQGGGGGGGEPRRVIRR